MSIYVNITAGEILLLLDKKKRAISLEEIQCDLGQPARTINLAVGTLIRQALVNMKIKGTKRCIAKRYNPRNEGVLNPFGEACCCV